MELIFYTKAGCHLCEDLHQKLKQVQGINFELEMRDITTRKDWFTAYQYEIPVLIKQTNMGEELLPRLSPKATVEDLTLMLQKFFPSNI
jgi:pyrimidine operon attenuation protein/uracil phosphoribosyltransferase